MKVGILGEGSWDGHSLPNLVKRVVASTLKGYPLPATYYHHTEGRKSPEEIAKGISLVLSHEPNFIVSVYDVDEHKGRDLRKFKDDMRDRVFGALPVDFDKGNVVFGFPQKEVEDWLLHDHETVRRILKMNPQEKLWDKRAASKETLNKLIDQALEAKRLSIADIREDIYMAIASEADIEILRSNPSFDEFYIDLTTTIQLR